MIIPELHAQANIRFTGLALPTGAEITLGLNKELWSQDATAAAVQVLEKFQSTAIRAVISSSVTIDSCKVKFGPNATGPEGTTTNPLPGTASGSTSGPGVAFLVRKVTGFGGRTGRGRFYIPGVTETTHLEGGGIAATAVSQVNTALEAFRTALIAIGLVPTLLHSANSPVTLPRPITGFVTDSKTATQRRRLRR
jgi:enamine deaminase RidA (YjgF/YER057c/UK114 family)